MNKRKLDSNSQVISVPDEHSKVKKAFLEVDEPSNPPGIETNLDGGDIETAESVEEFNDYDGDLDEENELAIRDMLLEESSGNMKTKDGVNTGELSSKVVKLKGKLPNLVLPPGWIALCHRSGGIVYLHRDSRVCTWGRPYHIGHASVRKHDVPTAAIPCLHEFSALKKFGQKKQDNFGQTTSNAETNYAGCHDNYNDTSNSGDRTVNHDSNYDAKNTCDGHDGGIGDHDGNLDNHDGNLDNHDGNLDNQDGNLENQDGNLENLDGNLDNQDGNRGNKDGSLDNQYSNPDNHGGSPDNQDVGDPDNQDGGDPDNQDGSHGNHDANPDTRDSNLDYSSNVKTELNNADLCTQDDNLGCSDANRYGNSEREKMANNNCNSNSPSISPTLTEIQNNVIVQEQNLPEKQLFEISSGEIEMCTATDLSHYLAKLWEFQAISDKNEKLPLFNLLNSDLPDKNNDGRKNEPVEIHKTIPYLIQGAIPAGRNKSSAINPAGKSPQSLLHEYCTRMLKVKPTYKTEESGNPKSPFVATVEIDGLQYGSGIAANKKHARHIAAQATMDIFLPGTFEKLHDVDQHLKIFDDVLIEDASVYELTSKLGLLSPSQVLNECVKRNQGVITSEVKFEMHHTAKGNICYSMECGKHKATGPCRNKKTGRELASQALLQKLHPHLETWGSLLRIYIDKHTTTGFTKPEDTSVQPSVNKELLSDLKHEMWKLKNKESKQSSRFTSTRITDIDF